MRRLLGATRRLRRARRGDLSRARLRRLAGEKMRRPSPATSDARPVRLPAARESSRGLASSDGPQGRRRAMRRTDARPRARTPIPAPIARPESLAAAASAARPATSPLLYRIAAWETGGGGGKAASAAGADSSGPGVGRDGSEPPRPQRRGPGRGAKHRRRAFKVGISELDLKVRVGPRSLGRRRGDAAQARLPCRRAMAEESRRDALIPKSRRRRDNWGRRPSDARGLCRRRVEARQSGARSSVATSGGGRTPFRRRTQSGKRRRQRPEAGRIETWSWVQSS